MDYSLNAKGIQQAATILIQDNAVHLIQYIYKSAGLIPDLSTSFIKLPEEKKEIDEVEKIEKINEVEKIDEFKKIDKLEINVNNKHQKSSFDSAETRIGLSIRILAKTNHYYDEDLINLILSDIDSLRINSEYLLSFKDPKARKNALDEEYALVQGFVDMDDTISLNQETESKIGHIASSGNCIIQ